MEREKIQLLAQLNKSMIDACSQLEEAAKKKDVNLSEQLKSYILEMQKKLDSSL